LGRKGVRFCTPFFISLNKILIMTIFNIELFGADADWFCNLTKSKQFSWIKTNTNQVNDDLINEFLSTPLKNKKEY
jgi:hypothetical protein